MEDLEKNIKINLLFDLYGTLLTKTQQKMISMYYQDDLSLGEISEIESISRNAVFDSIKKGVKLLEEYESKLHMLSHREMMENLFTNMLSESLTEHEEEIINKIKEKEFE